MIQLWLKVVFFPEHMTPETHLRSFALAGCFFVHTHSYKDISADEHYVLSVFSLSFFFWLILFHDPQHCVLGQIILSLPTNQFINQLNLALTHNNLLNSQWNSALQYVQFLFNSRGKESMFPITWVIWNMQKFSSPTLKMRFFLLLFRDNLVWYIWV